MAYKLGMIEVNIVNAGVTGNGAQDLTTEHNGISAVSVDANVRSRRKRMATEDELKQALYIASKALVIADDWNLPAVQVNPPKEWNLSGGGEDAADGWCSTYELAKKLG